MAKRSRSKKYQTFAFWAVTGTTMMVLLAILYQQYQQKNTTLLPRTLDKERVGPSRLLPKQSQSQGNFPVVKFPDSNMMVSDTCLVELEWLKGRSVMTSDWLKKFKVSFASEITQEGFRRQVNLLKRTFLELIHEPTYFPHIINPNTFTLNLLSQSEMDEKFGIGCYGDYDLLNDAISIAYIHNGTVEQYKRRLRNEFFHHQIIFKNLFDGIQNENKMLLATPFLTHDGQIAQNKVMNFTQALEAGAKRVKNLLLFFQDPSSRPELLDKAQRLVDLSTRHEPNIQRLSKSEFMQAIASGQLQKTGKNDLYYSRYLSGERKEVYIKDQDEYYELSNFDDSIKYGKASALLKDILDMKDALSSLPAYQKETSLIQLTELASYYGEFDSSIQQLLFPELYQFMTQFFCDSTPKKTSVSTSSGSKITYQPEKLGVDLDGRLKLSFLNQPKGDSKHVKQKHEHHPSTPHKYH